jgi:hypothetical protein
MTKKLNQVLALMLTIAALMTGQTAMATTKTYIFSGAQSTQTQSTGYFYAEDAPSTFYNGSPTTWIYDTTPSVSFNLADGITLTLNSSTNKLLSLDNGLAAQGEATLTVSGGSTYYIYHVRLLDSSGNVIMLDANGSPVKKDGVSSCDYLNTTKSFSQTYPANEGIVFKKIQISYATNIADDAYSGTGTSNDPYIISSTTDLDLLGKLVNAGNNFSGKYFQQNGNITYTHTTEWDNANTTENNFTRIGYDDHPFQGTFDGNNNTISGIRIYKGGNESQQGLFGEVNSGGMIKRVNLSDARITGDNDVGGIAGCVLPGATIEDCTVGADVCIHAVKSSTSYHGGIVGWNQSPISRCISRTTLTVTNTAGCHDFGGIAGHNSNSITDCIADGVVIPDVKGRGAIVGYNYGTDNQLTRNYYRGCTVASTANATGVGKGISDGSKETTDVNGARALYAITLGANVTLNRTASATLPNTNNKTNKTYTNGADIEDQPYAYATATVNLGYSGEIPSGMTPVYSATNGGTISGSTLTMPASSVTVSARLGSTTWVALQTQFDNASTDADNPTTITLDGDVTASSNDTYLELKGGRQVILDLNGHTIDRHQTAAQEGKGHVIQVSGSTTSLTIRDSSPGQTGAITGGWSRYGAGCINVTGINGGATLRLEGGTISGNRVSQNGGAISLYGNFYMTGGTITGNAANLGNLTSVYCGGALYFSDSSHFYMSGGSITGNYCGSTDSGAAGIGCYAGMGSSHVHLSGTYDISGNQQGTYDAEHGTWSNLTPSDILNHERITYDIDGAISPSQPARMIVDAHYSKATFTSGWATNMSGEDPEDYFTIDPASGLGIGFNASGEATIGTLHTITLADGLTASVTQAAAGKRITLSGATPSSTIGVITYTTYYSISYNDGEAHTDHHAADANGQTIFPMPDADAEVSSETHASVTYIDENGALQTCTDITLIESHEGNVILGDMNNNEKWYAVNGVVNINGQLKINDRNIHLILCDGASLTVNSATMNAIMCSWGELTIYGQSAQSGTLTATTDGDGCYGIKCNKDITINGGIVNATSDKTSAIYTSDITINRGTVSATGYYGLDALNNVTINGGTVTAQGCNGYYAIYGSKNVTINGGNVTTTGSSNGIRAYSGTLTLGWTSPTDRIYASSYTGTVKTADGQSFYNGSEVISGTIAASDYATKLNGQTLVPYGMTLAAKEATVNDETNYWTTYYCGDAGLAIDDAENACAYTATYEVVNEVGTITLHKLGKVIPAGTAVIIVGADASIGMTVSTADAENVVDNHLHGLDAATPLNTVKTSYGADAILMLSNKNDKFGFHDVALTNIPARKAFLAIDDPDPSKARQFTMVFDENTTAINEHESHKSHELSGAWYTLDGRRIANGQKPTAKGLYIVNGKKVVIK